MVVGGAALRVFREDGRVREGDFTLRVTEGVAGDEVGRRPVNGSSELDRLERLLQMKATGEVDAVPWLDSVATRQVTRMVEEQKESTTAMFLSVALPTADFPVVYCDVAGDLSKQLGTVPRVCPFHCASRILLYSFLSLSS